MTYSRDNPSPRFHALLEQYRAMHRDGDVRRGIPAEETFNGKSLKPQARRIKELIDRTGAKVLLDYGSGKGDEYSRRAIIVNGAVVEQTMQEYWCVESIRCW